MVSDRCRVHRLVADVALFSGKRVLLVRYRDVRRYDGQQGWFLPDDLLAHGEHPEAAAQRILREQVRFPVRGLRLGFIESFGGEGDPWHLVFHFKARVGPTSRVHPKGNVVSAEWFPLDGLPPRKAMAHHGWGADVLAELRRSRA